MALHVYPGLNQRAKLKAGQAALPGLLGLEKSYDILGGTMILSKVKVVQRPSSR